MEKLSRTIVQGTKVWLLVWALLLSTALPLAPRLAGQLKGGGDAVEGTLSAQGAELLESKFGKGAAYVLPVVLEGQGLKPGDPALALAVGRLNAQLSATAGVRGVAHAWNTGLRELVGKDGASALLLVTPDAGDFSGAELLVERLRQACRDAGLPPAFRVSVTGAVASFHDLNRASSEDVLKAERWGIPLTLFILLLVFGSPLAAALPLLLALGSALVGTAGLYLLSPYLSVNVFAQNAITMIGLGVGVDYALIIVSRFRAEIRRGLTPHEAAVETLRHAGVSVAFSGLTVALGFGALLLVPVPFLHAIALGGMLVVAVAVAASVTLLPGLLALSGRALDWPRKSHEPAPWRQRLTQGWAQWAGWVMRHPWWVLLPGLALLAFFIHPATHLKTLGMGAHDLAPEMEARRGSEALTKNFSEGWMGPVALLASAQPGSELPSPASQAALMRLGQSLSADPRVEKVIPLGVSPDRSTALFLAIPKAGPESQLARELVQDLRRPPAGALDAAGIKLSITGAPALLLDFDEALFKSLWTLIPVVLLATFVALAFLFRSVLIPLKAVLLNLASVLAAYGFLVLVFQDGALASSLGIQAVGGLNSFIVVMLFTILFGLSMDYEIFLLMAVREEHLKGADDAHAVAQGLAKTAGLITSAALIMVCLFGSFALTRLAATKMFGLGLAFAVGLDATLIRMALVPALMELFGKANWWFPFGKERHL